MMGMSLALYAARTAVPTAQLPKSHLLFLDSFASRVMRARAISSAAARLKRDLDRLRDERDAWRRAATDARECESMNSHDFLWCAVETGIPLPRLRNGSPRASSQVQPVSSRFSQRSGALRASSCHSLEVTRGSVESRVPTVVQYLVAVASTRAEPGLNLSLSGGRMPHTK